MDENTRDKIPVEYKNEKGQIEKHDVVKQNDKLKNDTDKPTKNIDRVIEHADSSQIADQLLREQQNSGPIRQ